MLEAQMRKFTDCDPLSDKYDPIKNKEWMIGLAYHLSNYLKLMLPKLIITLHGPVIRIKIHGNMLISIVGSNETMFHLLLTTADGVILSDNHVATLPIDWVVNEQLCSLDDIVEVIMEITTSFKSTESCLSSLAQYFSNVL